MSKNHIICLLFNIIILLNFISCETLNISNVNINWTRSSQFKTDFTVKVSLYGTNLTVANAWLGIGFNNKNQMVFIFNYEFLLILTIIFLFKNN